MIIPTTKYRYRRSDPQGARVYTWEDQFPNRVGRSNLTARQFRWLIRAACRLYGVPAPRVFCGPYKGRNSDGAYYIADGHKVVVQKEKYRNSWVALHEAAHAIDTHYWPDEKEIHNKKWLGIYFNLLVWHGEVTPLAIKASAACFDLRYAPLHSISPVKLRKLD